MVSGASATPPDETCQEFRWSHSQYRPCSLSFQDRYYALQISAADEDITAVPERRIRGDIRGDWLTRASQHLFLLGAGEDDLARYEDEQHHLTQTCLRKCMRACACIYVMYRQAAADRETNRRLAPQGLAFSLPRGPLRPGARTHHFNTCKVTECTPSPKSACHSLPLCIQPLS